MYSLHKRAYQLSVSLRCFRVTPILNQSAVIFLLCPLNSLLNYLRRSLPSLICSDPARTPTLISKTIQVISLLLRRLSHLCKNLPMISLVQGPATAINKTTSLITSRATKITKTSLRCRPLRDRFLTCRALRWPSTTSKKTCLICLVTEAFVHLKT